MQQNFINSLLDYTQDAVTAQSLGAAMLQSNGMIVPDAMPEIALLISNFSRPVVTNNESADYNGHNFMSLVHLKTVLKVNGKLLKPTLARRRRLLN